MKMMCSFKNELIFAKKNREVNFEAYKALDYNLKKQWIEDLNKRFFTGLA